jgi:hypothetical protein
MLLIIIIIAVLCTGSISLSVSDHMYNETETESHVMTLTTASKILFTLGVVGYACLYYFIVVYIYIDRCVSRTRWERWRSR